jgi:hypothetical protein
VYYVVTIARGAAVPDPVGLQGTWAAAPTVVASTPWTLTLVWQHRVFQGASEGA